MKSEERTKKSLCVSLLEGQHHDPHLLQSEIQPPFPHEVCSFASVVKTTKIAELKTQFPAELDKISEVVRILVNYFILAGCVHGHMSPKCLCPEGRIHVQFVCISQGARWAQTTKGSRTLVSMRRIVLGLGWGRGITWKPLNQRVSGYFLRGEGRGVLRAQLGPRHKKSRLYAFYHILRSTH